MSCYNCKYHRIKKDFVVNCVYKLETIEDPWAYCEEFDQIEGILNAK